MKKLIKITVFSKLITIGALILACIPALWSEESKQFILEDLDQLVIDEPVSLEEQVDFLNKINTDIDKRIGENFDLKQIPKKFNKLSQILFLADNISKLAVGGNVDMEGNQIRPIRQAEKKAYSDQAINMLEQVYSNHPSSYLTLAILGNSYLIASQFSFRFSGFIKHPETLGAIYLNRAVRRSPDYFLIRYLRFTPLNLYPENFAGEDVNEIILEDYLWLKDQLDKVNHKFVPMLKNTLHFLMARNQLLTSNKKTTEMEKDIVYYLKQISNVELFFDLIEKQNYPDKAELLKIKSYIIK